MNQNAKPIQWSEELTPGWDHVLTLETANREVPALVGRCPRCTHAVEIPLTDTVGNPFGTGGGGGGGAGSYVGRALGYRDEIQIPPKLIAICHCHTPHPGTPPGKDGCGAFGGLDISPDR